MPRKRRTAPTPASDDRPAGQPAVSAFALNPYTDVRFTTCPRCGEKTRARKLPLVIHVDPLDMAVLNMSCRFSPACGLLIARQDEVERLLVASFKVRRPEVIGNAYHVLGTLDRADWRRVVKSELSPRDIAERMMQFAEDLTIESEAAWAPEATPEAPPPAAPKDPRSGVPNRLKPRFDEIVAITDLVCREHLTEECAQLCLRLAASLCRKRPSPVERGRPEGWACGITYAIGSVNFIFDKSQTPHFSASELCALFGVSLATGSARAGEIRKLYDMGRLDVEWCLPSRLDDNPLAWLIEVNGMLMDARRAPPEVQVEALRKGLIPYLPPPRN